MTTSSALDTKLGRITPADLPTPPEVAIRVMRACSDPDVSSRQISSIIGGDAVLVAELLRMVNSPFFGIGREIDSVSQAVVVLGLRPLRNFMLLFSARESLRAETLPGFDALSYWEAVLRRAVGARLLAEALGADADVAFTVGVLQDIGLLALFVSFPEQAKSWEEMRALNPEERLCFEADTFGTSHDHVAHLLCKSWSLPDEIALPLTYHHRDFLNEAPTARLSLIQIAACADWVAAVFAAADKRLALARCRKLLGEYFGFSGAQTDELIAAVPARVESVAKALNLTIATQSALDEVLTKANRELIETSINERNRAPRLEHALSERERLAEELQQAYERLAQLAYYDPLTTLVNRRRFEELFSAEIARHSRSGKPLSLVMLDLDHFKLINDAHGHPFGDAVLQAVGGVLKDTLRSSDVAARVGGEELCLVLPETDSEGARIAAERVRCAIARLSVPHQSGEIGLTASFGGYTWRWKPQDVTAARTAPEVSQVMAFIIAEADKALYASKLGGRNRISWSGGGTAPPTEIGRGKAGSK